MRSRRGTGACRWRCGRRQQPPQGEKGGLQQAQRQHPEGSGQGKARPEQADDGRGILINQGGNADVRDSRILDNYSDGVGVFNNAFARLQENLIERNGRAAAFESGIQIARAIVRSNGNVIRDNAYAAISAYNSASYRTGDSVNAATFPDHRFAFEQIEALNPGQFAVDMGRDTLVDLRMVNIRGPVSVGRTSQIQIRGDNVGANTPCATLEGTLDVYGHFSVARFRQANHVGDQNIGPDARLSGSTVCP